MAGPARWPREGTPIPLLTPAGVVYYRVTKSGSNGVAMREMDKQAVENLLSVIAANKGIAKRNARLHRRFGRVVRAMFSRRQEAP